MPPCIQAQRNRRVICVYIVSDEIAALPSVARNSPVHIFELLDNPKRPAITAAMPPARNQTVLSVGEPVKKRETSELNEFEDFTP